MDKMKMLEARIPEKEKLVKQLKPNKKELEKIEQLVKVSTSNYQTSLYEDHNSLLLTWVNRWWPRIYGFKDIFDLPDSQPYR